MNKDIVFIIIKLQWRYWMHKIKEKYHQDYEYKYNSNITGNMKKYFIFNFRRNGSGNWEFIYNLLKGYNNRVSRLPKNYF